MAVLMLLSFVLYPYNIPICWLIHSASVLTQARQLAVKSAREKNLTECQLQLYREGHLVGLLR